MELGSRSWLSRSGPRSWGINVEMRFKFDRENLFKIDRENLFRTSVLFSVLFHVALLGLFSIRGLFRNPFSITTIEIDLTKPFRIGGNPLLKPGGGTTEREPEVLGPPALPQDDPVPETRKPPKDWILPGPHTRKVERPAPPTPSKVTSPKGIEEGTGGGYQGTGGGFGGGDGEGGGIPISQFPRLLNRRQILRLLRKNYPPIEWQAGQEGRVIVDLHLDDRGQVTGVEVVGSAGRAFDRVAETVAMKMRFTPARVRSKAVAVKIRQAIVFRIKEDGL